MQIQTILSVGKYHFGVIGLMYLKVFYITFKCRIPWSTSNILLMILDSRK